MALGEGGRGLQGSIHTVFDRHEIMHWHKLGQDGAKQVDCGLLPSIRRRDKLVYDRRRNGDAGRIQCQPSGRETGIELEGREDVKLSIDTVIEK